VKAGEIYYNFHFLLPLFQMSLLRSWFQTYFEKKGKSILFTNSVSFKSLLVSNNNSKFNISWRSNKKHYIWATNFYKYFDLEADSLTISAVSTICNVESFDEKVLIAIFFKEIL